MTVRHADEIPAVVVKAGDHTRLQVLLESEQFIIRRFLMAPGGGMPAHTNTVEHGQYVLTGKARIEVDGQVYDVQAGDVVFIPAGVLHWYQNTGETDFEFLCIIPNKPDEITLAAKDC